MGYHSLLHQDNLLKMLLPVLVLHPIAGLQTHMKRDFEQLAAVKPFHLLNSEFVVLSASIWLIKGGESKHPVILGRERQSEGISNCQTLIPVISHIAWCCSPCLKLKPITKGQKHGYLTVNVEPYGGGLWHTWFDRDLTVAGRVLVRKDGKLLHRLVDF